ncbi:hypothetical protein DL769_002524 [Monosporascus sp. CRB-8-3]|nr:hypothetical protein DL769_002524 [Monosporascus sp. CRB-8-3]
MNRLRDSGPNNGKPARDGDDDHNAIVTRLANEDKVPWYRKPNLRNLYFMLIPTCMGIQITSGFHSQMVNAMQILPSWVNFFGNPQGSLKGIIAAAYPLGAVLSLPLIPVINDRFGRRWSIFVGSSIMVVASLIQGFATNGSSLIGELGYPNERAVLTSLFSVSYFIGQITAAGICFGTNSMLTDWGWRVPSLLQIAPSMLQLAFVFFVPESPRWLVARDRSDEALKTLVKYHGEDRESQFVKAEMAQIQSTLHVEMQNSRKSWLDLTATAGMRKRLLTTSFLVEIWPYAERSRGIAIFQLFARCAEFFTTFVNPIGLANISWRYFLTYCCFLAFEVIFVYFFFPETSGKTLEEATFLFEEDKPAAEKAILAVENSIVQEMVEEDLLGPVAQGRGKKPSI